MNAIPLRPTLRWKQALFLGALALLGVFLTGCGFHLRGATQLPFKTLYVALPTTSELRVIIARNVRAGSNAEVIDNRDEAEAVLEVISDAQTKTPLSLNSNGRVREYRLERVFSFRLHNGKGRELLVPATIRIFRDITYNDDQVLAKEQEENLIRREMQGDMVQQLMRRLAAAKAEGIKID